MQLGVEDGSNMAADKAAGLLVGHRHKVAVRRLL